MRSTPLVLSRDTDAPCDMRATGIEQTLPPNSASPMRINGRILPSSSHGESRRGAMPLPQVHYPAVLVAGIAIFILGGLWYSPVLFAKRWVALMGKTEEELKAAASGPVAYVIVFICGLL